MKKALLLFGSRAAILWTSASILCGQSVGINTQNPHPSSVLDVQSVQAGALLSRLTTVQRNQIAKTTSIEVTTQD